MNTISLYRLVAFIVNFGIFSAVVNAQDIDFFKHTSSKIDSLKKEAFNNKSQKKPYSRLYIDVSSLYQDLLILDSAFFYAQKGISIAQQEKDIAAESRLWGLMASTTYYTGDFEKGIKWAKKSLEIAQNAHLDSLVVTRMNILGLFYIETGRNKEAITYYEKALKIFKNLPESKKSAYVRGDLYRIYANMAEAYENLGEYPTAIRFHQNSFEEAQKLGAYRAMAIAKIHLSECEKSLKREDLVLSYLSEAVEYSSIIKDWDMLNQAYIGFIDYYISKKKLKEAEKILNNNLELISRDSNRISIKSKKNLYTIAHKLYREKKDFQKSLNYLEQANKIDKIIYQKQSSYAIDVANVEFQTLEKERERIQAENDKKRAEIWLLLLSIVALMLILGLVMLVFIKTRQQLAQTKELATMKQEKEKEIRETISNTQEFERERIAKELHDGIGTMLAVTRLNVELYANNKSTEVLGIALHNLQEVSQEVRRIAHNLMPISLSKLGLIAALESFCNSIQQPKISFYTQEATLRYSQTHEVLLFRICQEAIHNAIKYAQASEIFVQILSDETTLFLQIEDNGIGFDVEKAKNGLGIKSMFSRATILDAQMKIDSSVGKGTVVALEWSIPKHK